MNDFIEKFRPLINKFADQLNYECAESDLVISLILLVHRIELTNFSGECDGQIVNYITVSMRNSRNNLYHRNVMQVMEEDMEEGQLEAFAAPDTADENEWMLLLTKLPKLQREITIGKFLYGFSDVELAKRMRLSRQYVHRMENRALDSLRTMLEGTQEHKTKIN